MECNVNGPGEMADAYYGYVGKGFWEIVYSKEGKWWKTAQI